jgi:hypothetical protein
MDLLQITLKIKSELPDLILPFTEIDAQNMFYGVDLKFENISILDNAKVVLTGTLTICGKRKQKGSLEYNFATKTFRCVTISKTGKTRQISSVYKTEPDPIYHDIFEKFIALISTFLPN